MSMPTPLSQTRMGVKELHDSLYMRILTGKLRPGAVLSESRVAKEAGVSRTPVRQVFQKLADAGFLIIIPQVGTYVAPISMGSVRDAQFVRESLECSAVARAASSTRSDKEQLLHPLLEEQQRLIRRKDHVGFFLSDETMHRRLMEIAGHPHVWDVIASAKVSLDRLRYISLERSVWLDMIFRQHEDLVGRVVGGDPTGAVEVMQAHLRTAFAAVDQIAADNADFFVEAPDADIAP